MITKRQKALLHVAKAKTGMREDEYRALLAGFGVASSSQLPRGKFDDVIKAFINLGFMPRPRKKIAAAQDKIDARRRLRAKLTAIVAELNLTMSYVDAIAKKRFGVDAAFWCDAAQLYKLVQMMSVYQNRLKKRAGPHA